MEGGTGQVRRILEGTLRFSCWRTVEFRLDKLARCGKM